jgi:hypothetical protein
VRDCRCERYLLLVLILALVEMFGVHEIGMLMAPKGQMMCNIGIRRKYLVKSRRLYN